MLSKAKHLAFSSGYEVEILRLSPQNDIATQSLRGNDEIGALTPAGAQSSKLFELSFHYCAAFNRPSLDPRKVSITSAMVGAGSVRSLKDSSRSQSSAAAL